MSLLAALLLPLAHLGSGTTDPGFVVPETSIERPEDAGIRSHTDILILKRPSSPGSSNSPLLTMMGGGGFFDEPGSSPEGYSPSVLRATYGVPPDAGAGAIAIVCGYNYPTARDDFNVFSRTFGLPTETSASPFADSNRVLQVVYAQGSKPPDNASAGAEMALDIEWSHAMAPYAKIYLVEAPSLDSADLYPAIRFAARLPGVTQVSMSFGCAEFEGERQCDAMFDEPGVTFFAASGDIGKNGERVGHPEYPAISPYVVGVGGTTLKVDSTTGISTEEGWVHSGGGPSNFEIAVPPYQRGVTVQGNPLRVRGSPDIAADGDPTTGVPVYDSTPYTLNGTTYVNWFAEGGTSLSSPLCAGIANALGWNQGSGFLPWIYANGTVDFRDITTGGPPYFGCHPGWDFVTGLGSLGAVSGTLQGSNAVQYTNGGWIQFSSLSSTVGQDGTWEVTATGNALFGGASSQLYDSVVIAYNPAGSDAQAYTVAPSNGNSVTVNGKNLCAFITDTPGNDGDNSGAVTVQVAGEGQTLSGTIQAIDAVEYTSGGWINFGDQSPSDKYLQVKASGNAYYGTSNSDQYGDVVVSYDVAGTAAQAYAVVPVGGQAVTIHGRNVYAFITALPGAPSEASGSLTVSVDPP